MIDTIKTTVTTPTLTPRIVSIERSLLARTVSIAIQADSLMSANVIRDPPRRHRDAEECWRAKSRTLPLSLVSSLCLCASAANLFRSQRFNGIQLRGAPRRPQSADYAYDRRHADAQHGRPDTEQQRKADQ